MPTFLIIDQGGQLTTLRDNIGPQGPPGTDGVGSEWLAVMSEGGDGVADPAFGNFAISFR